MEIPELSPQGDLPPNHPLVLEALKGIIGGPIAELRATVDKNITNPSTGLKMGNIDYNRILPTAQNNYNNMLSADINTNITNDILNNIAPVQYINNNSLQQNNTPPVVYNVVNTASKAESDPNQMELPLFKQADIGDLFNKMFDIEKKLDVIIKHVKNTKN